MNVKYCGPARDYSGYGEANRHDIAALVMAGVQITTQIPKYCLELSDFGRLGDIASKYENRLIDYRFKIIHTTPNVYHQFFEPGKYHIGRVFWETDRLPNDFTEKVQACDEIWTGSEYNKQAIINSGVTKPIYIIPEAIDIYAPDVEPYKIPDFKGYKFYSIFEWTERKNWRALLEAYWREFEHERGVMLVLKTYVDNFTQDKKYEIQREARELRNTLGLSNYAPIQFFFNLMDRNQIYRFHKSFDCFVSAHRGEGWGIPQMEALLMGKAVISTNCGGIHEYLKDGETAKLIPYEKVKLQGNTRNHQWYSNDQHWAEVDKDAFRKAMRWAFSNPLEAAKMGEAGKHLVEKTFSLEAVGNRMVKRLIEIS